MTGAHSPTEIAHKDVMPLTSSVSSAEYKKNMSGKKVLRSDYLRDLFRVVRTIINFGVHHSDSHDERNQSCTEMVSR